MSDTEKKTHDSRRRRRSSSSASSKKTISGHLSGGRIGDSSRPKPSRSSHASSLGSQKKRVRPSEEPSEKGLERPEKKSVKSHRSKPKSARRKAKKQTSHFSIKTSWPVRLLSFTGFTHNRLTKKDGWGIMRRFCIGAFPLMALAFAAHAISLNSGRLWLDHKLLSPESFINTKDGILQSWLSTANGDYAPVPWFTMWIEHFFWGGQGSGYHFFNLIAHSLNVLFVWRLCQHFNLRLSTPWLVAAIFAVHPLCFPAVGWIYARPVLLSTTFLLASLLAFTNYDKPNSDDLNSSWLLLSVIAAGFASFCQAGLALVIPFLALGIMGFKRGTKVNTGIRHVSRCLPLFIVIIPGVIIAFVFALQATPTAFSLRWLEQLQIGGWLAIHLPVTFMWPTVAFFMPPFEPGSLIMGFLPLGLLVISLSVLFFLRRLPIFRPLFFLLWSWAFILFGMIMAFPHNASFHDGVIGTYLVYPAIIIPAIALISLVAWPLSLATQIKSAAATNITGVILVGFFLFSTLSQISILKTPEAFWRQGVQNYPGLPVGNEFLGRELVDQKRYTDAMPVLRRARELAPANAKVCKMLGQTLLYLGQAKEAEIHLRKAFKLNPDLQDDDIENELQKQLEAIGNNPQSLPEFLNISVLPGQGKTDILDYDQLAFTTNDTSFGPDISRAFKLVKQRQIDKAVLIINALLKADPQGAMGHYLAGYVAFENKAFDKAVIHLRQALQSQPNLAGASFFLGVALRREKQYGPAREMLGRAIRLRPKMEPAFYQLGLTSEAMNQGRAALALYKAAIRLQQNDVPSLQACAELLATSPDPALRNGKQALKLAQQAILYAPTSDAELLMTLAAAYAEAGFFPDAVRTATRAVLKADTPEGEAEAQKRLRTFQAGKTYEKSL